MYLSFPIKIEISLQYLISIHTRYKYIIASFKCYASIGFTRISIICKVKYVNLELCFWLSLVQGVTMTHSIIRQKKSNLIKNFDNSSMMIPTWNLSSQEKEMWRCRIPGHHEIHSRAVWTKKRIKIFICRVHGWSKTLI